MPLLVRGTARPRARARQGRLPPVLRRARPYCPPADAAQRLNTPPAAAPDAPDARRARLRRPGGRRRLATAAGTAIIVQEAQLIDWEPALMGYTQLHRLSLKIQRKYERPNPASEEFACAMRGRLVRLRKLLTMTVAMRWNGPVRPMGRRCRWPESLFIANSAILVLGAGFVHSPGFP